MTVFKIEGVVNNSRIFVLVFGKSVLSKVDPLNADFFRIGWRFSDAVDWSRNWRSLSWR